MYRFLCGIYGLGLVKGRLVLNKSINKLYDIRAVELWSNVDLASQTRRQSFNFSTTHLMKYCSRSRRLEFSWLSSSKAIAK